MLEARLEKARGQANGLANQQRFEEALAVWEELRKTNPEQQQLIQAEVEKLQQAQARVKEEQRKGQLNAILARAEKAKEAGQWETVIAVLEEYLSLEPADEKILLDLDKARQKQLETQVQDLQTKALNLSRQEQFDEALAAWKELLKLAPQEEQTVQAEIGKLEASSHTGKNLCRSADSLCSKEFRSSGEPAQKDHYSG